MSDLRCYVTGNFAGSDTWPKGYCCACRGCVTFMARMIGLEPNGEPPQIEHKSHCLAHRPGHWGKHVRTDFCINPVRVPGDSATREER